MYNPDVDPPLMVPLHQVAMAEEVESGVYPTIIQEVVEETQRRKMKNDEVGTEEEGGTCSPLENQKEELPT